MLGTGCLRGACKQGRLPSGLQCNGKRLALQHEQRTVRTPMQRPYISAQARKGLAELMKLRQGTADQQRKLLKYKQYEVTKRNPVPDSIPKPPYVGTGKLPNWVDDYQVHDEEGIAGMRAACKLAAQVREYAGTLVKAGVTTDAIDKLIHEMILDNGAYPSPLGYGTYPKSVCTSVNECICHGIPDTRPLEDGDVLNIDVTVYLNGYHGDTSRMFYVGNVSDSTKKLCEVTEEALHAAIKTCGPGVPFKKIGDTIQTVADKAGFKVVRDFIGHGVGTVFHSAPNVFHFRNNEPGVMMKNMTFTIEPMLVDGNIRYSMWPDDWTVVTKDGSLSAQYEHTLLITDDGAEILTLP